MMHLVEVIDGSLAVPYKRLSDYLYGFRLPGTEYKYLVNFTQDGDTLDVTFKVFNENEGIGDEGTHDRIDLGMKLAAKVFHTVWKIIEEFLHESLDPIDYVTFGAKNTEPSRVRFYDTLAKQLAKAFNQDPADITVTEKVERETNNGESVNETSTVFTVPIFVDAAE